MADFRSTMYSTVCLLDRNFKYRFSPFETFYPRYNGCVWDMSVIFTPLERLIHILSNGVTNSIFFFLDIRLISLEHVTSKSSKTKIILLTHFTEYLGNFHCNAVRQRCLMLQFLWHFSSKHYIFWNLTLYESVVTAAQSMLSDCSII